MESHVAGGFRATVATSGLGFMSIVLIDVASASELGNGERGVGNDLHLDIYTWLEALELVCPC